MHLPQLSFLALLPALAGCATVAMMKGLPPDAGGLARYSAPPDTLVAVAEVAIRQQHLLVVDTSRDDAARVMIGRRTPGLFSKGEYVGVRIVPDSAGLMAVRIVSQSGDLLDWFHRDLAPRVFQAIDAHLSAAALGPWPGTRVRATPRGASAPLIGTVARVTPDSLALEGGLRVSFLDSIAVSRGGYRHTRAGALIGLLLGGFVGGLIGSASGDPRDPWARLNILAGISVGIGAGAVVGGALGAGARTEIWSPVPIH